MFKTTTETEITMSLGPDKHDLKDMTDREKVAALVESGLAETGSEAVHMLVDMGDYNDDGSIPDSQLEN